MVIDARPRGSLWGPLLILSSFTLPLAGFGFWLQVSGYDSRWYDTGKSILGAIGLVVLWWLLRREGTTLRGCVGRFRAKDLGWALVVGLGMSAISLGTWLIAADWLRRKIPAPDSEFFPFSTEFMIRALVEPVWITFMVNLLFLGYALPRLRARFGPVWATVIVAFCSGLVQMGYNLQGPVTMMISMLLGFLLVIPPALVTLATGSTWPGFLGYLFMVQLRQLEEVLLALLLLAYMPVFWLPLILVALAVCCWCGAKTQGRGAGPRPGAPGGDLGGVS